ncbi:DUF1344 domain-containing protein [Aureimonas sp. AU12]|uniref:DUF1344 domain-containing protein n=1 Tax=Aureimonas sp. AU12 TaxID=1638161 RepID=UPI000A643F45|nr:DUF1344 domain-containing protein [Aureimonas sp. AU12]
MKVKPIGEKDGHRLLRRAKNHNRPSNFIGADICVVGFARRRSAERGLPMTRRVVAFFACSFLTVSISIPAVAEETGGVVEGIDRDSASLKLTDGTIYRLPTGFDYASVKPGMQVHMLYEPAE